MIVSGSDRVPPVVYLIAVGVFVTDENRADSRYSLIWSYPQAQSRSGLSYFHSRVIGS